MSMQILKHYIAGLILSVGLMTLLNTIGFNTALKAPIQPNTITVMGCLG
ncbi:MAG: hypothetical protein AAGI66_03470 [Cyanobacteria bacterium P01_H01_bin.74]